jgi:hypothetical protein
VSSGAGLDTAGRGEISIQISVGRLLIHVFFIFFLQPLDILPCSIYNWLDRLSLSFLAEVSFAIYQHKRQLMVGSSVGLMVIICC